MKAFLGGVVVGAALAGLLAFLLCKPAPVDTTERDAARADAAAWQAKAEASGAAADSARALAKAATGKVRLVRVTAPATPAPESLPAVPDRAVTEVPAPAPLPSDTVYIEGDSTPYPIPHVFGTAYASCLTDAGRCAQARADADSSAAAERSRADKAEAREKSAFHRGRVQGVKTTTSALGVVGAVVALLKLLGH